LAQIWPGQQDGFSCSVYAALLYPLFAGSLVMHYAALDRVLTDKAPNEVNSRHAQAHTALFVALHVSLTSTRNTNWLQVLLQPASPTSLKASKPNEQLLLTFAQNTLKALLHSKTVGSCTAAQVFSFPFLVTNNFFFCTG
jgi:hypothetical protein